MAASSGSEAEGDAYIVERVLDFKPMKVANHPDSDQFKKSRYDPSTGDWVWVVKFLVRWKDYDEDADTWEPRCSFVKWLYDDDIERILTEQPKHKSLKQVKKDVKRFNEQLRLEHQEQLNKDRAFGTATRKRGRPPKAASQTKPTIVRAHEESQPVASTSSAPKSRSTRNSGQMFNLNEFIADGNATAGLRKLRITPPPEKITPGPTSTGSARGMETSRFVSFCSEVNEESEEEVPLAVGRRTNSPEEVRSPPQDELTPAPLITRSVKPLTDEVKKKRPRPLIRSSDSEVEAEVAHAEREPAKDAQKSLSPAPPPSKRPKSGRNLFSHDDSSESASEDDVPLAVTRPKQAESPPVAVEEHSPPSPERPPSPPSPQAQPAEPELIPQPPPAPAPPPSPPPSVAAPAPAPAPAAAASEEDEIEDDSSSDDEPLAKRQPSFTRPPVPTAPSSAPASMIAPRFKLPQAQPMAPPGPTAPKVVTTAGPTKSITQAALASLKFNRMAKAAAPTPATTWTLPSSQVGFIAQQHPPTPPVSDAPAADPRKRRTEAPATDAPPASATAPPPAESASFVRLFPDKLQLDLRQSSLYQKLVAGGGSRSYADMIRSHWNVGSPVDNLYNFDQLVRGKRSFIYAGSHDDSIRSGVPGAATRAREVKADVAALQLLLCDVGPNVWDSIDQRTELVFVHARERAELDKRAQGKLEALEKIRCKSGEVHVFIFGEAEVEHVALDGTKSITKERALKRLWTTAAAVSITPAALLKEREKAVNWFYQLSNHRDSVDGRRDQFVWVPASFVLNGGVLSVQKAVVDPTIKRAVYSLHMAAQQALLSLTSPFPLRSGPHEQTTGFPAFQDRVRYDQREWDAMAEWLPVECWASDLEGVVRDAEMFKRAYAHVRRWIVVATAEECESNRLRPTVGVDVREFEEAQKMFAEMG